MCVCVCVFRTSYFFFMPVGKLRLHLPVQLGVSIEFANRFRCRFNIYSFGYTQTQYVHFCQGDKSNVVNCTVNSVIWYIIIKGSLITDLYSIACTICILFHNKTYKILRLRLCFILKVFCYVLSVSLQSRLFT